jgi:hypothetical protein
MAFHGQEPVPFEDVKDEIFDMVRPADPYRITLQDLFNWWVQDLVCLSPHSSNSFVDLSTVVCSVSEII